EVRFLRHGVVLASHRAVLPFPGIRAWVSAEGLRLDLSQGSILVDDACRNRLDRIVELAEPLMVFARRVFLHDTSEGGLQNAAWLEVLDESIRPAR
ncbi:MAG: hypothetical protein AB1758_20990, partial [Candidatus Eremiobacterota bacterium]